MHTIVNMHLSELKSRLFATCIQLKQTDVYEAKNKRFIHPAKDKTTAFCNMYPANTKLKTNGFINPA